MHVHTGWSVLRFFVALQEPLSGDELAPFLEEVSNMTPTIPLAAVQFYLMKNGFNTSDDRVCVCCLMCRHSMYHVVCLHLF